MAAIRSRIKEGRLFKSVAVHVEGFAGFSGTEGKGQS